MSIWRGESIVRSVERTYHLVRGHLTLGPAGVAALLGVMVSHDGAADPAGLAVLADDPLAHVEAEARQRGAEDGRLGHSGLIRELAPVGLSRHDGCT